MIVGQDMGVIVWHHRLREIAGSDLFPPDNQRDVDSLARHLREPFLERRTFSVPRSVAFYRLIDGSRHAPVAVESGDGADCLRSTGQKLPTRRRHGVRCPSVEAAEISG